jgi:beta-N-acetylhexosaminidase
VSPTAAIVGLSGTALTAEEAALLRAHPPAGIILFSRNISDPQQLARLIADLRALLPEPAVLMVDQEGGRVVRLRPPHWRWHPAANSFHSLYRGDPQTGLRAAWLHGALIGVEAASAGFDVVAAPVLDMPFQGNTLGDRLLGSDPYVIGVLGRAIINGLLSSGIQPVAKHVPGHGQAVVDSHLQLPVVETLDPRNLVPFSMNARAPWMMTAHILYRDLDPDLPATCSKRVLRDTVRGTIAFAGVLVSDDLAMSALVGSPASRALRALAAGCDIALYCPGDAAGNSAVLSACPPLTSAAATRLASARALAAARRIALDAAFLEHERISLLARVADSE